MGIVKKFGRFFQLFVAFSEYLMFNIKTWWNEIVLSMAKLVIFIMFFMNCSSLNAESKPDLRNLKFQNRKTFEWGNPLSKSTGSWTERTTMWCEKWRTLWFHSPSNLASAGSACTVANTQCQTFSWFFNFHGT